MPIEDRVRAMSLTAHCVLVWDAGREEWDGQASTPQGGETDLARNGNFVALFATQLGGSSPPSSGFTLSFFEHFQKMLRRSLEYDFPDAWLRYKATQPTSEVKHQINNLSIVLVGTRELRDLDIRKEGQLIAE